MRWKRSFLAVCLLFAALAMEARLEAQNIVPNPGFDGEGGRLVAIGAGSVNAPFVPDSWRAFAVGGAIDLEIVPLEADEVFPGSPATNAVLLRVNSFGGDQGFDDDNGRFPVNPGLDYHLEFYVKSANADESEQSFNFGFPLFNAGGVYLQMEPGGRGNNTATEEWQLVVGPTFRPSDPVDHGHISWRCRDDGGENAILIALPAVTFEGMQVYPTGLACSRSGFDVELSWQNHQEYDSLAVLRDGEQLAELDVAATAYLDADVPDGTHTYQVLASFEGLEDGPTCEATVVRLEAGTRVSVDLGDLDTEDGLANSQRIDGGDGENEFVICGPDGDPREARSNWGGEDPTFEVADNFFYFNVTDAAMKSQSGYRLEVTVYDDPLRAGAGLALQYTNAAAEGPADIPDTFFPLGGPPINFLEGTDEWVVMAWDIENAGFRSFQQGSSDFRLGVTDGGRVCIDRVDLVYFPAPTELSCARRGAGVALAWRNSGEYDAIRIWRDGEEIDELPGDATSYVDEEALDGLLRYRVVAVAAGFEGGPSCEITVFFIPEGTRVSVDLGDPDDEVGMANTQRLDGGDGENEPVRCGPQNDPRDGRANLAGDDPTADFADPFFYFEVTDPGVKAQSSLRVEATVYDDPSLAGTGLFLQYTNRASSGSQDIPNTFFPLEAPPLIALEGSGEWVVLAWDIPDAGFRSFQQGTSDFRLGVTGGERVCIDVVEVVFTDDGSSPTEPVFHRGDVNGDGVVNLADAVRKLDVLFSGQAGQGAPECLDAADANDDGRLNIAGAVFILNWLFASMSEPPAPGPHTSPCGPDPSDDDLGNSDCVYTGC